MELNKQQDMGGLFDLPEEKGGFFNIPKIKKCNHPSHDPPKHLHIPQGKGYRHICPACGYTVNLIPLQISH